MAVPNRVLVLRLHRDFEEPNVYIAILEAFQKLGYDRPTHLLGPDIFIMLQTGSGKSLR